MKKNEMSLIINSIIAFLVLVASISMFVGFKFMPDNAQLEASNVGMFKFYTVDSNILMGIIALVFAIYQNKLIKNKIKEIPQKIYVLKLIGTFAITLTFVVTFFFLVPQYGLYTMYNNNNLFFHLIVPILSIITYVFFEEHDNKYRYAFLGMTPMVAYSIYYSSMILDHLNNGGLTYKYDYYGFLQGNINNIYVVIPVIYIFSYLLSLVLIFLNKKFSVKNV